MFIPLVGIVIVGLIIFTLYKTLTRQRKRAGVSGWVSYEDLSGNGKSYKDIESGIICKPDVVVGNKVIEYKSGNSKNGPYESDVLQAGAEMIVTGKAEAELRYANKSYAVKNTPELRRQVYEALSKMRYHLINRITPAGSPSYRKCKACTFGMECPQSAFKDQQNILFVSN